MRSIFITDGFDWKREQIWRRHLEQQRSSGVTARAYCRANAIQEIALYLLAVQAAVRAVHK